MIPAQTTKPYPFRLSTADADAFLDTLTEAEARSMLMELLGRDEDAFITAMERVERTRARYAEAVRNA
ncbi:hypothetical protein [Microbispora rosea]|uniref:hypothetical protein n=1 Tax=Microbispora rosea TaxID=58117 RepID=UPI0004C4524C|nr:hypothetical protein [Microbispora rosea]